jgi:hypothetical protein
MTILAARAYRIDVQLLLSDGHRYFVEIRNRSYHSRVEVSIERARIWYKTLEKRKR